MKFAEINITQKKGKERIPVCFFRASTAATLRDI
jgi:hypothetical protein